MCASAHPTMLVVPVPNADPGPPLQGVSRMEAAAEDPVGRGEEGDRWQEWRRRCSFFPFSFVLHSRASLLSLSFVISLVRTKRVRDRPGRRAKGMLATSRRKRTVHILAMIQIGRTRVMNKQKKQKQKTTCVHNVGACVLYVCACAHKLRVLLSASCRLRRGPPTPHRQAGYIPTYSICPPYNRAPTRLAGRHERSWTGARGAERGS